MEDLTKTPQLKAIDGPGTDTLSKEEHQEYAAVADRLAKDNSVSNVHVVVQIKPDTFDRAVCYLKEPNYLTKIRVMDKAATIGIFSAADELRELSVIRDASDAITYSESPESDAYKLGVVNYCIGMVNSLQNQFKKK